MTEIKFKKMKYICVVLVIISLIVSILVPVLPSVDPNAVDSESKEHIEAS